MEPANFGDDLVSSGCPACWKSRRNCAATAACTSLRGGVADVAIQRFCFSPGWCGGQAVREWNWIAASATPPRN